MNRSDAPKKQSVPFAINGKRESILSTTPAGDNTASYDVGFPAVTMILKAAGGLPPKGEDMNQILYELSSIARWVNAGGGFEFDSSFASDTGGYPLGAMVLSTDGSGHWLSTKNANTTDPENTTADTTGWVPVGHTGMASINIEQSDNATLTTLQAGKDRLVFTGAVSTNVSVVFPAWAKEWTVVNNCSGSGSITCKTKNGSGVAIPNGSISQVAGDGQDIVLNIDATLSSLADLATSENKLPYFTGQDSAALTDITSIGRGILSKSTTSEVVDYLGLINSSIGSSGWRKNPDGTMEQWGGGVTGSDGSVKVYFPSPFPSACLSVTGLIVSETPASNALQSSNPSNTDFTMFSISASGTPTSGTGFFWRAIGQ